MKKVPYTISDNSITIFWEGKPYTLRSDHANFKLAEKAILDARYDDLGDLLDISKAVENFVEGEIEVKDEIVYYKGHRLHGVVVDKLLDMLRSGMKDSAPLTNFITRLQANPSANSVNELYSFLSYKSLATTPEGRVLGYKGVQGDFWSSTGNADTIVVQGETNDRHQILNEVGATIEVARRCVDDNKDNHCSFGLHVGSYDYANGWAGQDGRLLLVEFDPQDAVSVPTDCDFQKLRVSKYKVVSDITGTRKELNTPVYEANMPIYGSDDSDYLDDEDDYLDEDDYDSDDLDERYDIDDEPKVTLPDNLWKNNGDGDDVIIDDDDYLKENENGISLCDLHLAIRTYIGNKTEVQEIFPTINHINSLKICRDSGMTCRKTFELLVNMGYDVEDNDNKTLSQLLVAQKFWGNLQF
tara:strand:+ start:375 stop:1613 length:1239 start_codon:yes stop_codon:yes gene_type:complete